MANYFKWDLEVPTITVSSGVQTPVYNSGSRTTEQSHSPTHSLKCVPVAVENGNNPSGVSAPDTDMQVVYPWTVLNSRSLYYRFWAMFLPGFSWGDGNNGGHQKVKLSRTSIFNTPSAPGGGLVYTGYMNDGGFELSEGYWAGTDSPIMVGGDHFALVTFPGGMTQYADGKWHEYILRVKPNTTALSYDGEFEVFIDNVSKGSYNAFSLVSNRTTGGGPGNWLTNFGTKQYADGWAGWGLAPYWQISGSAGPGGGTVYFDDFSIDDTYNSIFANVQDTGLIPNRGTLVITGGGDVTDPTCTITGPTNQSTYATSIAALNVSGTAADDVVVSSVTWQTNRGASGTASGTTAWNFNVTLSPGINIITVTAHDGTGHIGNATLTVTLTTELWNDDFEIDRLASYYEFDTDSGNFLRSTAVPFEGSYSLRSQASIGNTNNSTRLVGFGKMPAPGFFAFAPVDAGVKNYPYIKMAFYHRADPGWAQTTNGVKLARISVFAASSGAQAAALHLWTTGSNKFLTLDPASGTDVSGNLITTTWNDLANLRFLGLQNGSVQVYDASNAGHWFLVEIIVKLNTPGNSDGFAELWIDGVLDARCSNLNWLGNFSAYAWNTCHLERYWNAGAPAINTSYFDKFVVTDLIGGVDTAIAPAQAGLIWTPGADSPVVSTTTKRKILLPSGAITFAPTLVGISKANTVNPSTGAVVSAGIAPVRVTSDRPNAQTGAAAFTSIAGASNVSNVKVPATVPVALVATQPQLIRTTIIQPNTGGIVATGPQVGVFVGSIVPVQTGSIALTPAAAVPTTAQFIAVQGTVLTLSPQAALLFSTGALAINSGVASMASAAPVITRQFAPQIGVGVLSLQGRQPSVVQQPAVTITPGGAALGLVGLPPDIFVPITGTLTLTAYAPDVVSTRDRTQTKQGAAEFTAYKPVVVSTHPKPQHGPRTILRLVAPLFKRWF